MWEIFIGSPYICMLTDKTHTLQALFSLVHVNTFPEHNIRISRTKAKGKKNI